MTHFELLTEANDWTQEECTQQLTTSLKRLALEILRQLSKEEGHCYKTWLDALQRRYGTFYQ